MSTDKSTGTYTKCACTTSDGKVVIADPSTVKWCKFLTNMLEGVGTDDDESCAIVMCDSNMFNFVNRFCKFYDNAPYDYAIMNQFDERGILTRKADYENGRPIIKFTPLFEMAKNACKSDTKNYAKRKAAWEWLNKALDAAEYFDCDPLITEVSRSICYIITSLDPQSIQKVTSIDADEWTRGTQEVIQERTNKSNAKYAHSETFDSIYNMLVGTNVSNEHQEQENENISDDDIAAHAAAAGM
jgi:hypothetical protein